MFTAFLVRKIYMLCKQNHRPGNHATRLKVPRAVIHYFDECRGHDNLNTNNPEPSTKPLKINNGHRHDEHDRLLVENAELNQNPRRSATRIIAVVHAQHTERLKGMERIGMRLQKFTGPAKSAASPFAGQDDR